MSNDHDLDPEIKRALDERIEWIEQVTGLARAENWPGVQAAINDLDPAHLRSMIYVLVLARGGDAKKLRWLVDHWSTAAMN
jgi:hypothetical protein